MIKFKTGKIKKTLLVKMQAYNQNVQQVRIVIIFV